MCFHFFEGGKDVYTYTDHLEKLTEKEKKGNCEKCGKYEKLSRTHCYNFFHDKWFEKNICNSCEDDEHGLD
jgi:hypothetical protein